jgi:hypothetical protein
MYYELSKLESSIFDWPALLSNSKFLLICLTVSSRKNLSNAPCFFGGFLFHLQGIANCKDLLSIYSRDWFLKDEDVRWIY